MKYWTDVFLDFKVYCLTQALQSIDNYEFDLQQNLSIVQAWSTVHSNLKLPGTQFSAIGIRISRNFCVKKGLKDTVVKTTAN